MKRAPRLKNVFWFDHGIQKHGKMHLQACQTCQTGISKKE